MPWANDREARRRSDAVYKDPQYVRNRAVAWRRAGGRCEVTEDGQPCGSRDRCQVDHLTPVSQGGTHNLENLGVKCHRHHLAKTATEGGGFRSGRRSADPDHTPRTQWG